MGGKGEKLNFSVTLMIPINIGFVNFNLSHKYRICKFIGEKGETLCLFRNNIF